MCGIAGYIGQSKNSKLTYELITGLFDYLELRGTDAAGVWGTESDKKKRVIYHKEPIKSSKFVQKSFWKNLQKVKMDLMLVHARATSKNSGHASTNSNNHPFVSEDKKIAMIHNGTLDEADFLKKKYQIRSQTDSEVLLRMYEYGLDDPPLKIQNETICSDIKTRLNGIKEIWSLISKGAMAVSFGERFDDDTRYLFLFRNQERPLWIADLRETLGQVFFFSSPEIWYRAMASSDKLKKSKICSEKLIEIPTEEVWVFKTNSESPSVTKNSVFYRFAMDISQKSNEWDSGNLRSIKKGDQKLSVISHLDDNEEIEKNQSLIVCNRKKKKQKYFQKNYDPDDYQEDPTQTLFYEGETEHETICKQIIDLTNSVEISASNSVMEGSMSHYEYTELVESLNQTKVDLEGTLRLIGE